MRDRMKRARLAVLLGLLMTGLPLGLAVAQAAPDAGPVAAPVAPAPEAVETGEASTAVVSELRRLSDVASQGGEAGADARRFYDAFGWRPAWHERERVAALVGALEGLARDGLMPADYRPERLLPAYRAAYGEAGDARLQARLDLDATRTLMRALRDLTQGKVDPHALDPEWDLARPVFAPDWPALAREVEAADLESAFERARPDQAIYRRLRQGLARYRAIEQAGGWAPLPPREGPLRPGDRDSDVALLRERLAALGELELLVPDTDYYGAVDIRYAPALVEAAPDPRRYDPRLVAAVERFQRRHLLTVDGVVGADTLAALNVGVGRRVDQIRLNLERARWLLHDLPASFVLVDIAGFEASYFRPDGEVWRSRVVVGKPYRETPTLRSTITHLTFNPTWTIPPTILREDVLPRVRDDQGYLASHNISVLDPSGRRLDPASIDWQAPGGVMLRQAAGPANPLGRVVVRFPNRHAVYLHDTPSRALFGRARRAFSSGCIRVEGVMELARLLFEDDRGWGAADIQRQLTDGRTRNVSLRQPVPVILHYWTVHVSPAGELSFKPDIYDRDADLLTSLNRSAQERR